ncbi:MAG: hypothetical protein ACE5K3_00160 [bacterium]
MSSIYGMKYAGQHGYYRLRLFKGIGMSIISMSCYEVNLSRLDIRKKKEGRPALSRPERTTIGFADGAVEGEFQRNRRSPISPSSILLAHIFRRFFVHEESEAKNKAGGG